MPGRNPCSICGEKESLISVRVLSDGKAEEKGLCGSCAIRFLEKKEPLQHLTHVDKKLLGVIEEMRDLLSGIISNISSLTSLREIEESDTENNRQCSNCGVTFEKFRETGYLGCPYCYSAFGDHIREFILEMERGSVHKGRMPRKYAELYLLKKEILFLRSQLRRSVTDENYEKAEKIRRRLEKLVGNSGHGDPDAIH